MNDTITTRKIDELGRIVLPIEIRKALKLESGDSVDIAMAEKASMILLHKSRPSCYCCQGEADLKRLPNGAYICADCLKSLDTSNDAMSPT